MRFNQVDILYKGNGKNTYKWMRKNLLQNYNLVPPTRFNMDYLRYKITKISGRKCLW